MRKFGVEIEAHRRRPHVNERVMSELNEALAGHGVRSRVVQHGAENYSVWQIQSDGSLPAGTDAFEIASPPLSDFTDLEKVCEAMEALNITVAGLNSTRYGLHVHIDATDMTLQQVCAIALAYDAAHNDIVAMLPPSRRDNRFCRSLSYVDASRQMVDLVPALKHGAATGQLSAADRIQIFGARDASTHYDNRRYRTVNVMRYLRARDPANRTIEFRAHSGTVDFQKIKNWVLIIQNLVETTLSKLAAPAAPAVPAVGIVPDHHTRARRPRVVKGGTKVAQFIERCKNGTASFEWCETELGWTRDTTQSWAAYVRAWDFPLKSIKLGRTVLGYTMENQATVQARLALTPETAATILKFDINGLPPELKAYYDQRKAAFDPANSLASGLANVARNRPNLLGRRRNPFTRSGE